MPEVRIDKVPRTMLCPTPQREKIQTRLRRIIEDREQELEDAKTLLKYLPDNMPAKDESRVNRILERVGRPY
jgi:hypothetical protein